MGKGGCRAGAGRPGRYRKTGVASGLDVRWMKRQGLLTPGKSGEVYWSRNGQRTGSISYVTHTNSVWLSYRSRWREEDWKDYNYPVQLAYTTCNYGGGRAWFLCPDCGERCTIRYISGRGACRKCHQLVYESQSENPCNRTARGANKIRDRLGWEPGILNSNGWKPKGMHWRTFGRLTEKHNHYLRVSFADMKKRYGFCF